MLSVGERMKQCSRHAKVSWAGQGRQFSFLIMLFYTNVMFKLNKYVNFSMCIDVKPHFRTLNENNYKSHNSKPVKEVFEVATTSQRN